MASTSAPTSSPKHSSVYEALSALYDRRWLAAYFIQRQIFQSTKGSFLGVSWLIITPLLMIALYTLVFSEIVGLRFRTTGDSSIANFGLYLYCGLIPFLALGETLNKGVTSIKRSAGIVQKVVFPLEILPLSTAITAFITQFFGLAGLSILLAVVERELRLTMLLLPLVMIPQLIFMLGAGFLVSVLGTYLPDVRDTMQAVVRALFFCTPIIWPAQLAYDRGLGFIIDYNPLAYIVVAYRDLILEGAIPDMMPFLIFTLFSTALLVGSFLLFVRTKWNFADLV